MTDSAEARSRVLRATALGAVTVALALGAHLLSGGSRPTAPTVLQSLLVVAVVMGLLAGGRRRPTTLLLGLGGSQLLLHEWFALATPGECAGHLASQYVPGLHLLPQQLVPWGLLADTARACATTGDTGATLVALAVVAHALAALVSGVLLTRGEALLGRAVGFVLPALPAALPVVLRRGPAARRQVMVLPATAPRRHAHRRGPPGTACAT